MDAAKLARAARPAALGGHMKQTAGRHTGQAVSVRTAEYTAGFGRASQLD
jgi:hypothetical protein